MKRGKKNLRPRKTDLWSPFFFFFYIFCFLPRSLYVPIDDRFRICIDTRADGFSNAILRLDWDRELAAVVWFFISAIILISATAAAMMTIIVRVIVYQVGKRIKSSPPIATFHIFLGVRHFDVQQRQQAVACDCCRYRRAPERRSYGSHLQHRFVPFYVRVVVIMAGKNLGCIRCTQYHMTDPMIEIKKAKQRQKI